MTNRTTLCFGIGTVSGLIVLFFMLTHPKTAQQERSMQQSRERSIKTNSIMNLSRQTKTTAKTQIHEAFNAAAVSSREFACAYNGSFSDDMLRYYFTNMVPASHFWRYTRELIDISNTLWYAFTAGIRTPTNLVDYARFCIDAYAIHKNEGFIAGMLAYEATNACYLNVWRTAMRKYYVTDYEQYSNPSNSWNNYTCKTLLLYHNAELQPNGYELIPTFTAVTNFNDLYMTIMCGKKPEVTPGFAYLDPAKYPQEARDWALHFPNPYTRYQQQSAWKGPRGTGQVAIVVLEEILKSWDTDPPYLWKNNPAYPVLDRRNMRMIIEEKKQSLAGTPK